MLRAIALCLVAVALVAAQPAPSVGPDHHHGGHHHDDHDGKLHRFYDEFHRAFESRNITKIGSFLSDDGEYMAPSLLNSGSWVSKSTFLSALGGFLATVADIKFDRHSIVSSNRTLGASTRTFGFFNMSMVPAGYPYWFDAPGTSAGRVSSDFSQWQRYAWFGFTNQTNTTQMSNTIVDFYETFSYKSMGNASAVMAKFSPYLSGFLHINGQQWQAVNYTWMSKAIAEDYAVFEVPVGFSIQEIVVSGPVVTARMSIYFKGQSNGKAAGQLLAIDAFHIFSLLPDYKIVFLDIIEEMTEFKHNHHHRLW